MSGWQSWVCAASAAAVLLGTERTGHADSVTLFAITFDNELISVDPTSGAGTLIGYLESPMAAFGLADRGGDLWTFDQHPDVMVRVDTSSGATLETVDIGVKTTGEGAVAYGSGGTGFLTRSYGGKGKLWSFDVTTVDSASEISSPNGPRLDGMDGMDFDGSDMLYGLSHTTDKLYTIDQTTGSATAVGLTGLESGKSTQGLTFAADGTLFAAIDNSLYRMNPSTGAATLIGPISFDKVSGLSFLPTAAIPVPAAAWMGLILLGMLGMLRAVKAS